MVQSTIEHLVVQIANVFLKNGYNHRSIHEKEVVMGKIRFLFYQKTRDDIAQFHEKSTLDLYHRSISLNLAPYYEIILVLIRTYEGWNEKEKSSIQQIGMPYFKWLAGNGVASFEQVDESIVRKYLLDCTNRITFNSVDTVKRALKKLPAVNIIDRSTSIGKRDYAIDWINGEIRTTQSKTEKTSPFL